MDEEILIKENENIINEPNNILDLTQLLKNLSGKKSEKTKFQGKLINILQYFYNEPKIINNRHNLICLFEELFKQLQMGNNIIIPFLDLYPNLIKSYIDSDLDEDQELKYIKVFNLLKINSFINRENLYPIYEYFSDIYYDMEIIKDSDIRLKKFNKVFELWKIFYDFKIKPDKIKYFNKSSICFLGGGLQVKLIKRIVFKNDITLKINIKFLDFFKFYKNNIDLVLLSIDNKYYNFDLECNKMNKCDSIILLLMENKIIIKVKYNRLVIYSKEINFELNSIKNFFILKNFFGQITTIKFTYKENNIKKRKNIVIPYILNDSGTLPFEDNDESNYKKKNNFPYNLSNKNNEFIHINI